MKISKDDSQAINDLICKINQDALMITGISEMAAQVNFSVSKLNKVFKEQVGVGPATFLREKKMNFARRIHADQALSWTEIAYEMGYADLASFSKAYKRIFGKAPTATK